MSGSVHSKSKKASTVSNASVPATPAASAASAKPNPIPTNVSAPPEGWNVPTRLGKKGRRPTHGLNLGAADLAGELRKNATALLQELGPKAVDPTQLAAALDEANAWRGVEGKASAFHVYARVQRGAAWDHAVNLMTGMKLGIRYAVARDASFADRFPEVAKAFAPARRRKPAAATGAGTTGTPAPPKATKSKAKAKSTTVATEPAVAQSPEPVTPTETPAHPTAPNA
jgi:hypothetical protein